MRLKYLIWRKLFAIFCVLVLVLNTAAPALNTVYADEIVTPTPISTEEIITSTQDTLPVSTEIPTPTPELAIIQVVSDPILSPTPEIIPEAPSPSPELTPTEETPIQAETPILNTVATDQVDTATIENTSAPDVDLITVEKNESASLVTDKLDYTPTDTALITGSALNANTIYFLTISSSDNPATSTTVEVITNADGVFAYTYQLDGKYRPNYKIELKDRDGNIVTSTTFTDVATTCDSISACQALIDAAASGDIVNLTVDLLGQATGVGLTGKSGVIFDGNGHVLEGNGVTGVNGVVIDGGSGNTIRNLTTNNWGINLSLLNTSGNTINNVSATNGKSAGLYIQGSDSNIFDGCTVNSNSGRGFNITNSPSNIIENTTINANTSDGIGMTGTSNNTTIRNSNITNNLTGISTVSFPSSPTGTTVYNNYLKNTTNYAGGAATLNTALVAGTNIMGGSNIGGNYWDNLSGTGFSQTCTDADVNGICDLTYTVVSGATDNYPLLIQALVLTTITVDPGATTIDSGTTLQLTAVGLDQNGTIMNPQPTFTWESGDPAIATIDSAGLVTGVTAGGPVTITATSGVISGTASITVTMPDTTAPVITLSGANPQTIEAGNPYVELGATALDDVDGDISANIVIDATSVNTNIVGSYLATYNVSDAAGNPAIQVSRTVDVIDTTAPVITLLGTTPVDVVVGTPYADSGATALDNLDGDISANIVANDTVNIFIIGSYTVTYDVTDAAGNPATSVVRTVNVVLAPPVLTTINITPVDPTLDSALTQAFTAETLDQYGDPFATSIVWSSSDPTVGTINSSTGEFTPLRGGATTITATSGLVTGTSQVTVQPVLTTINVSPTNPTIAVGNNQTFAAAILDQFGNSITATVSWTSSDILVGLINSSTGLFTALTGGTTVITATSGLVTGTTTVTVPTPDTTVPVITLVGANPQTIEIKTAYSELGATATDDIDGNIAGSIVINSSAVNTNLLGSYTVTYNVSDAAGNPATQISRTVDIVDTENPIITFVSKTAPNANGWNNTNVTANWSCSDSGSGVVSPSMSQILSTEGANQSATGICTDNAGNVASDTQTGINIDKTAPTVIKLGNNSADVALSIGDTGLVFSEVLSDNSKIAVQNALSAGADNALSYSWSGNTLTITAVAVTTFINDVIANVSDLADNTASLLIVDSQLADTQTAPDGDGNSTSSTTTPQVVVSNPTQPVVINVNDDTSNPTIDVSALIANGAGSIPQITINSDEANVVIPATTVTGPAGWNGVFEAPTVTEIILPQISGETRVLRGAIELGFADGKLSFNNAVKIIFAGEAGDRIGYSRPGTSFTEITNICSANNQTAGDALPADGDCKINVGADLVVWTKHFTKFATYTQTTNSTSGSGVGDGRSDGLGCGSHDCSGNLVSSTLQQVFASSQQSSAEVLSSTTVQEQQVDSDSSPMLKKVLASETSSKKSSSVMTFLEILIALFVLGSVGFWISKIIKKV